MKKVLKAEMWDKMQYLFRNYYDRTMHAVYFYDGTIDEDALKRVYDAILKKIPVLHSTFHNNFIRPYWTVNEDYTSADYFELVETDDVWGYLDKFLGTEICAQGKVQFRVKLIRANGKDVLATVCNHMCFDGPDLKYFNSKVAETYTEYKKSGKLAPDIKSGTRSAEQVYSAMNEEDYKHAKSLYKNVSTVENKHTFPFAANDGTERSRLVLRKLDKASFLAMKARGKAQGATINDIILAAYFRALFKVTKAESPLTVPCMYDLRKYIGGSTAGLTNLIGFMPCTLSPDYGKDMEETVEKVKEALLPAKNDRFTGLYSLPLLKLAYTVFPHFISEIAIGLGYTNPYIGMSNIGIIKPEECAFDGMLPSDAFYSGAIKFKPYMQLAFTTFMNEITFTIGIRGNDKDAKIFYDFLGDVIAEIKAYADSPLTVR